MDHMRKLTEIEVEMEFEITNENVKACAIMAGWHGAGSVASAWAYLRRAGVIDKKKSPGDFTRR